MAELILAILGLTIITFGGVLLFGAPYLPTLKRQTDAALDLLELEPGQTLLDLGCGDGRVLRAAAKRGIKSVGYELNPFIYGVAKLNTWRYRKHVKVIYGDFWSRQWPPADGIFLFLHPRFMSKLDAKISADAKKPVRLASYAFQIPGKRPVKTGEGLFVYDYK